MTKRNQDDKSYMFMFYWKAKKPEDAPLPVPEYPFSRVIGRKHKFDWAFPQYRIAVEVDGGGWLPHGGRHGGDSDREKLNLAASLRWLVFRFSPEMLERKPAECMQLVIDAIEDSK